MKDPKTRATITLRYVDWEEERRVQTTQHRRRIKMRILHTEIKVSRIKGIRSVTRNNLRQLKKRRRRNLLSRRKGVRRNYTPRSIRTRTSREQITICNNLSSSIKVGYRKRSQVVDLNKTHNEY
jgi:hypothetical protein